MKHENADPVIGWVYGRGPESKHTTLDRHYFWRETNLGEARIHPELEPKIWASWEFKPEWKYHAELRDGLTFRTGKLIPITPEG